MIAKKTGASPFAWQLQRGTRLDGLGVNVGSRGLERWDLADIARPWLAVSDTSRQASRR